MSSEKWKPQISDEEDLSSMGEKPSGIPGQVVIPVPGIKDEVDFRKGLHHQDVASRIKKIHNEGREVAASWSAGEIRLYVAKHKREIMGAGAAVVGAGALSTLLYLRKRRKK